MGRASLKTDKSQEKAWGYVPNTAVSGEDRDGSTDQSLGMGVLKMEERRKGNIIAMNGGILLQSLVRVIETE
jgi:hypothetical protein